MTPAPSTTPARPLVPLPANVGTGGVDVAGTPVDALDALVGGGAVATAAAALVALVAVRVPRRPGS